MSLFFYALHLLLDLFCHYIIFQLHFFSFYSFTHLNVRTALTVSFFSTPPDAQNVSFSQLSSQSQKFQERLKELEKEVSGGATAVVALILNNKLYIANVGMNTFPQTLVGY